MIGSSLGSHASRLLVILMLMYILLNLAIALALARDSSASVGDHQSSRTAGPIGPASLQHRQLLQKVQRFDRERNSEDVVHVHGIGARDGFPALARISNLTMAKVAASAQVTPVFARLSKLANVTYSPETARDPGGFAARLHNVEGN